MNEEEKAKLKAELSKAKLEVIDRMVTAGWVSHAANNKETALFQPTKFGYAIMQSLREVMFICDQPMTTIQVTAFFEIIHKSEFLE